MRSYKTFKLLIIYVVAGACMLWVLRGVRFDELFQQMRSMNAIWLLPAVLLDILVTVVHGARWRLLLRQLGRASLFRTVQSIYASLFSNEILPLRAGELVRGYIMSRELRLPLPTILPTMIMERIVDGSLLVIGLGVCMIFFPLPKAVVTAGVIVGCVIAAVIVVFVCIAFVGRKFQKRSIPASDESTDSNKVVQLLDHISRGIRILPSWNRFFAVLGLSLVYMLLQVMAYWMVIHAYGIQVAIWIPAVVLIVVRLGTSVPSAPANIGPYQFFCVLALTQFGIDKTTAAGAAFTIWVVFSIPIMILGCIAFIRSGMSLTSIRAKGREN